MPRFMLPSHVIWKPDGLPRNVNGKIDRAVLRAQLDCRPAEISPGSARGDAAS
jgi:acyl-coenzyme A synthetase/AMP-(fatty) acid ligase